MGTSVLQSFVMTTSRVEQQVTVWLANEVPARMDYAGRRWTVTDVPTPLRDSVWSAPLEPPHGLHGWRFQATDPAGESYVFDVYGGGDGWHVHRAYS